MRANSMGVIGAGKTIDIVIMDYGMGNLRNVQKAFEHIGIYAYRREFLLAYTALAPTPLERFESLEQLRVLELEKSKLDPADYAAERAKQAGADIFIGGEMGIGNTTSAAALACAMDSSMGFGKWQSPAKNMPSVAKSTGLSFICASRKNPSGVVEILYSLESAPVSLGTTAVARMIMSGDI